MKTIDKSIIVCGQAVAAIYIAVAIATAYGAARGHLLPQMYTVGTLCLFFSPISLLIISVLIWRLIRNWSAVPARLLMLFIAISGAISAGWLTLGMITLLRWGPINSG